MKEIEEIEEEKEKTEEEPLLFRSSPSKPQSTVDIDGVDWCLTALLVTIDALLLELYKMEDTKWSTFLTWFKEVKCDTGWKCSLAKTIFLIVVAIINVFIVVPIVNINISTPSLRSWRFWLIASWASLFLLDIIVAIQLTDSITKAVDDGNDGLDYYVSHFWLVSTATLLTAALNIRFLLLYGPFTFLTCNEKETLKVWSGLTGVLGLPPKKISGAYLKDVLHVRAIMNRSMYAVNRANWAKERVTTFKLAEDAKNRITRFLDRRRVAKLEKKQRQQEFYENIFYMATEDVSQYLKVIENEGRLRFKLGIIWQKVLSWYDLVAEEPGTFEYTSWMKSAIGFTVLMLIYNCIKAMEIIFALDAAWNIEHNAATVLYEGLNIISHTTSSWDQSLQGISSPETYQSLNDSIAAASPDLQNQIETVQETIRQFIPKNATDSTEYRNAASLMHMLLISTSRLAKASDFENNKVVSAFFYVDSLMQWLKCACIVGYPIGTFIGFYSLFQVMAQHKRMAMSLEYESEVRGPVLVNRVGVEKMEIKDSLMGLEEKYPIGGAVYFFGVLMSTAVIQQHAFGISITLLVAIFLDINHFRILLDIGGSIAFICVVIIVTNLFCSHVIGNRILTQDGYKIKHPWYFFLFLFVFTIVHAALGFLYALWRALLLFIITFWVLNRLDISLFTAGKKLDNGHYSFMSMLLLSQVIHLDKKAQRQQQEEHSQDRPFLQ